MIQMLLNFVISIAMAQVYVPMGPIQLKPFADKTGLFLMPDAIECNCLGTETAGQYRETQCNYSMPFQAKVNGVKVILKGHSFGDYAYMTVRHPMGDLELARFGQKIMFDDSVQDQGWIESAYDSDVPAGLVLRFHYFTRSTTDVKCLFNIRMHKVVQ